MKRAWYLLLASIPVLVLFVLGYLSAGCSGEEGNIEPGDVIVNSIEMRLAYIPAGEFEMGSGVDEKGRADDEERHRVKLTRCFRIGVTEVTQEQWEAVMAFNRSNFKGGDL